MHDKTRILLKGARNHVLPQYRNSECYSACYAALLESVIDRLVVGIERGDAGQALSDEVEYAKD